ncbi:coniferyl aldehyde dehydrogenase [Bradyrhizobium sp. SZCCHNS1054]|uniref:coniferyl aldehyde dehydrogenase n=1 Tax=Bradyrhizobium sp. SZCCHNS1054 TaxID=3057301 RepID=UPI002915EEEC|nr:coniferyl aldehyde dehydrogenase [Bradyrhizobium sp. SZCCHNS1054]
MNAFDASALGAILNVQRTAFRIEGNPSFAVRKDRLSRLRAILAEKSAEFARTISRDFAGRSTHETLLLEAAPLSAALRHTLSHLRAWMQPETRRSSIEFALMRNRVIHQPLGVVGIMAPWNYPLLLTFGPLIDVLAAGNRSLIKPSELLPETSITLAEAIASRFDPAEVAVVNGGIDIAEAFSRLPFDHLVFTGSTAVGRRVMAAAAENLTPVTLELGGKSPAILAPNADLAAAARAIVFGKLMNAGQTCIAPDYVLVPRSRMDAFVNLLVERMEATYPPATRMKDYTAIVGTTNRERLRHLIEDCRSRGSRVITPSGEWEDATHLAPTLVLDPPQDAPLMHQEIFGPVLPIVPYDGLNSALAFVGARPTPLALYCFARDGATRDRVLAATRSGGVTLNGTLLHIAQPDLPFGGIGPSGHGAYHSREGFKRFSHARSVASVHGFDPSRLACPPFGRLVRRLERFMLRR